MLERRKVRQLRFRERDAHREVVKSSAGLGFELGSFGGLICCVTNTVSLAVNIPSDVRFLFLFAGREGGKRDPGHVE